MEPSTASYLEYQPYAARKDESVMGLPELGTTAETEPWASGSLAVQEPPVADSQLRRLQPENAHSSRGLH